MVGLRGIPATYGGVERAVDELANHLAERGHAVTVYARRGYVPDELRLVGDIELVTLPHVPTKHLEAITHTLLALVHATLSRRYDVIHIHATGPALLSFIPRALGVPVVATVQGLDWRREKWGRAARTVLWIAARAAGRVPSRTIVVSQELERFYREEIHSETTYIPNGVTAAPAEAAPERPQGLEAIEPGRYVLFLGRVVPEKHVHTLVQAFRQHPGNVQLVVAGPSSHTDEYLAEVQELAAADDRIKVVGPQYGDAKIWLMRNAAMFVQPSSIEGLPIALLEAMAEGAYPIVSEIPENLEPVSIDGEVRSEHVPVGDIDALTAAIGRAFVDPDRAAAAETLRSHVVATYSWANITTETVDLYQDVVRPERRHARLHHRSRVAFSSRRSDLSVALQTRRARPVRVRPATLRARRRPARNVAA